MEHTKETQDIFYFTDNYGNELGFRIIDLFAYNNEAYAIFMPVDGGVNVLIARRKEYDDYETYETVNDFDTLEAVFALFKDRNKDTLEFI